MPPVLAPPAAFTTVDIPVSEGLAVGTCGKMKPAAPLLRPPSSSLLQPPNKTAITAKGMAKRAKRLRFNHEFNMVSPFNESLCNLFRIERCKLLARICRSRVARREFVGHDQR
jgi:hypothetical protein